MDKEKILAALYAIQNGDKDIGQGAYHDELETLIAIVINAKDEDIAAAWKEIQEDAE